MQRADSDLGAQFALPSVTRAERGWWLGLSTAALATGVVLLLLAALQTPISEHLGLPLKLLVGLTVVCVVLAGVSGSLGLALATTRRIRLRAWVPLSFWLAAIAVWLLSCRVGVLDSYLYAADVRDPGTYDQVVHQIRSGELRPDEFGVVSLPSGLAQRGMGDTAILLGTGRDARIEFRPSGRLLRSTRYIYDPLAAVHMRGEGESYMRIVRKRPHWFLASCPDDDD